MKKVTRLLILTAFVFPFFTLARAYAGGPGSGQRDLLLQRRERLLDPSPTGDNPIRLQDPIGGNIYRDPFYGVHDQLNDHSLYGDHDPFTPGDHDGGRDGGRNGHPGWIGDPGANGGGGNGSAGNGGATAPLDGGISLLLAAGIGLGMKKARDRKKAAEQKAIENAE